MRHKILRKITGKWHKTQITPVVCEFQNNVWFADRHTTITEGHKTLHSTPTSPYYCELWFNQITNQIMINSNQITTFQSIKSSCNEIKSPNVIQSWCHLNHDLNEIMIWTCPSLAKRQLKLFYKTTLFTDEHYRGNNINQHFLQLHRRFLDNTAWACTSSRTSPPLSAFWATS